jgi:hypothetical protein
MWFAIHAILSVRIKNDQTGPIHAYENIFLIEAQDAEDAEQKGLLVGKEQEGDAGGSFEWEGMPARLEFEGVRKVIEVRSMASGNAPISGAEVTYNLLEFQSLQTMKAFAAGEVQSAIHCE